MLRTFFPDHTRDRTVVHAGPLLLSREDGTETLKQYLGAHREREIFLVHRGEEPLREAAQQSDVTPIKFDDKPPPSARDAAEEDARATAELALALGASRIDFAIDAPGLTSQRGRRLRETSLSEAEVLSKSSHLRPRIRAKLRAGIAALRNGVARVRLGNPSSLMRGDATTLRPDGETPLERREASHAPEGDAARSAPEPTRDSPLRFERFRDPRRPLVKALHYAPGGSCEIDVPRDEPLRALHDPWWRLRGVVARSQ